MRFIIGVDERTKLGGDLELALRQHYDGFDFQVIGIPCRLHCTTTRCITQQVECILEALLDFPAEYFVGISGGTVIKRTPAGLVPYPVTVITGIDTDGMIQLERVENVGQYIPWSWCSASKNTPPCLVDIICNALVSLIGTKPQPILLQLPLQDGA